MQPRIPGGRPPLPRDLSVPRGTQPQDGRHARKGDPMPQRGRRYSPEVVAAVRADFLAGKCRKEIAQTRGVTGPTVWKWTRDLERS